MSPLKRYEAKHTKKRRRIPVGYAMIIALVLSGVAVLSTSRAAFTDTTTNDANYVKAGSVSLDDNGQPSGVLFEIDNMAPGDTVTRCIEVEYTGSLNPGQVKLYSGGYTEVGGQLDDELDVRVRRGAATGDPFGDCTNYVNGNGVFTNNSLSTFGTTHTDYASGAGNWDPAAALDAQVYEIRVQLPAGADDVAQGDEVNALQFVWEVQS
jgi:hypothetical protein